MHTDGAEGVLCRAETPLPRAQCDALMYFPKYLNFVNFEVPRWTDFSDYLSFLGEF